MIKWGPASCLTKLARDTVPERAAINIKRQGIGRGGEPDGVLRLQPCGAHLYGLRAFSFPCKIGRFEAMAILTKK